VKEFRTVLDDEIGEPPRSTVDIESVIARQRRRTGLRVSGTVAAAVLAVAVAAAGSGAFVRTDGGGSAATDGRPTPASAPAPTCAAVPASPTPAPSPRVSGGATPTGTAAKAYPPLPIGAETRLTDALRTAVTKEIPAARLAAQPVDGESHPPLQFFDGPCDPHDSDFYTAIAAVRTAAGAPAGRLLVMVQTSEDTGCTLTGGNVGCQVSHGRNGETVMSLTRTGEQQGEVKSVNLVVVFKPDGTVLQLLAEGPPGTHLRAPLAVAALTRIGLASGLTIR
jgi:hypothetical protein